jgi:hypothetical protein
VRIFAVLVLLTAIAHARSERTFGYARDQAWPTALRFLRVDARVKILEKDADAGYVLFELVDDKKTFRGALEVVDLVKDGQHHSKCVITIEDRPAWMEVGMLDGLARKLRADLGPPPPPPPKKEPPKEPAKDPPPKDPAKDEGPPISPTP